MIIIIEMTQSDVVKLMKNLNKDDIFSKSIIHSIYDVNIFLGGDGFEKVYSGNLNSAIYNSKTKKI